jgi:hypothetical protein
MSGDHRIQIYLKLVFLDLPAPWDAVDHAKIALRVRANDAWNVEWFLISILPSTEGSYHPHMLFQSVYGTGFAHRQCS